MNATSSNRINSFIVHELDTWSWDLNSSVTLKDWVFGSVKLAKDADVDKYIYSSYCIEFNSISEFSLLDGNVGKNVIIFIFDMSSSVHIDNKGKDISILGRGPTQGLNV